MNTDKLKLIIKEEMEDVLVKTKNDVIERLQSKEVAYMELKESKFMCGFCIFLNKEGFCINKKVQSKVNPTNGCCNLYIPRKRDEIAPEEWAMNKNKDNMS